MTGTSAHYVCGGVPVAALTLDAAASRVIELAKSCRGADVHLCNAYTIALSDRDLALRKTLAAATLNLPDGMSVAWASRRLAPPEARMAERVYGPDLLVAVAERGRDAGLRHYLYGGANADVLTAFRRSLSGRWPDLDVVGAEVPPYHELDEVENENLAERIRASGAQIVWVGLGSPKQDTTCARLAKLVPATFIAVGAAYDFLSGAKPQAPVWMQRRGLEWAYRLAREPRRLWRRYIFGNARFLKIVLVTDRQFRKTDQG